MTGEQHTSGKGKEFAMWLMKYLRGTCDRWKAETGIGFGLYGTPAESLCYRFAKIDKQKFGSIKDITDKDYYTNSYHVDVRENIDAFSKLELESEFQKISSGGCISYIEIPNMQHNVQAIEEVIKYIYENVQYGEFNTKLDYCMECGYEGELLLDDDNKWYCPNCGNKDTDKMNITRRTCGYLGSNLWNDGKTNEIGLRVLHLGAE
jgi:ribonucleoside-triphosphate reductase